MTFGVSVGHAAPTSLLCHNETRPRDPAITLDLDDKKGTVKINYPAQTLPATPPVYQPARSDGPYKAVFAPKQITVRYTQNISGSTHHHRWEIDRLSGVTLNYYSIGAEFEHTSPNNRVMYRFNCQVAKARF